MKLLRLTANHFKSIREETIRLDDLVLFIGSNASGKSNILDALRFLHESLREGDFQPPVGSVRGGMTHLAWKGEPASHIQLETEFGDGDRRFTWSVLLQRGEGLEFTVSERVGETLPGHPPQQLMQTVGGEGWWWSADLQKQIDLKQGRTACLLAAAAANSSFPARGVAEFVKGWGFFDPSPPLLRRSGAGLEADRLDSYGKNLATRLYTLKQRDPAVFRRILAAAQGVMGLPEDLDFNVGEDSVYYVQTEPGLKYRVHQIGASSGTLRLLALVTALFGEGDSSLIGIEEPENHVHPSALAAFAEHLKQARQRKQIVITTHSPLLLTCIGEPGAIRVVRRGEDGTKVEQASCSETILKALEESGFGLGEFYETQGFGA